MKTKAVLAPVHIAAYAVSAADGDEVTCAVAMKQPPIRNLIAMFMIDCGE